ncbi:MAG: carboxylesterase family protein, partial [Caulobacteraceae bacterium]|nr:carboxylesterase family protein [Caulobacter sp.]
MASAAALAIAAASAGPAAAQTVRLAQGAISGASDNGAEVFKNIPYAAPPVGPLRWRPPQPAKAWTGVRDGSVQGPACPQPPINFGGGAIGVEMGDEGPFTTSEDCLNLNVRRPAGTQAGARLPVMVWIHGGAFSFGRGSQRTYTGTALVKRGVILVTINYRLGALGFLADPELTAEDPHHSSGEYGALDAIAALQWVKDNISRFGGDPGRVTIFGESAGGAMVGMLAGSPLTKGLFQHAISESGVFFGPPDQGGGPGAGASDTYLSTEEPRGPAFLKQAGVSTIAEARALPVERILAAGAPGPGRQQFFFRPNIDGWFLPKLTYTLLRDGGYDARPVLVGSNSDEGVLFAPCGMTVANYVGMVRHLWGAHADQILAAYPATTDAQALHAARDLQRDS